MAMKAILIPYDESFDNGIIKLMDRTIRAVCCNDYTDDEIEKWSPAGSEQRLVEKLKSSYAILALVDGALAGFGNTEGTEIDCLYVSAEHQGEGIGSMILQDLEDNAFSYGNTIHVYSSITAEGFFLCHGYRRIRENIVERDGVLIHNWYMEKRKDCGLPQS